MPRAWANWTWARPSTAPRAFCATNCPATPSPPAARRARFRGSVADTNLAFRVTLAWTDAPGNTTGSAYNNDLDLTVNAGGQTYLGNVFSGAWSVPGGAADPADNVESVFLPAGAAGAFTVTVTATSINSVGVPNASNGLTQDFALVIDNAAGTGPPVIAPAGAVLVAENCPPTNGVIDPGETVTVNFALQNIGTVNTTNLVATLLAWRGDQLARRAGRLRRIASRGRCGLRAAEFHRRRRMRRHDHRHPPVAGRPGQPGFGRLHLSTRTIHSRCVAVAKFRRRDAARAAGQLGHAAEGGQAALDHHHRDCRHAAQRGLCPSHDQRRHRRLAFALDRRWPRRRPSCRFRNDYNLEINPYATWEAFDGGVLEIQVGTNAFADILAAGGEFVTNGYNRTLAPGSASDNPLANRACWSGNAGGYVTTIVNLPAGAAGQNVQLRWRCATDSGNAYGSVGWWIDSVTITDGGTYTCCAGPWEPWISEARIAGTNFIFTVPTATNQIYVVEYNTALSGGAWTPLQTFAGDGAVQAITNALSSTQGFYRVRGYLAQ